MTQPASPPAQSTYLETAHAKISEALKEIGREIPEVEGFGVVILWRKPVHQSTGNIMLVGVDGPLTSPDPLVRISMGCAQLIEATTHRIGDALVALDHYQKDVAERLEALRNEYQEVIAQAAHKTADPAGAG
jgi:hypothetical protein